MTMARDDFAPVSAFAGHPMPASGGVSIREVEGAGIAMVMARKGQAAALSARIRERFGCELPAGPKRARADYVSFMGTAPGTWLAIGGGGGNAFASSLRDAIGDLASVVDQCDGIALVRVSGPKARDTLCKLFAIDLDARAFLPGDVAVTPAGHVGATLWRLDDVQGQAVFEIGVHRSFAVDFLTHLGEAAAEFGAPK
jgi:sarcosine oxidase subunit gamma